MRIKTENSVSSTASTKGSAGRSPTFSEPNGVKKEALKLPFSFPETGYIRLNALIGPGRPLPVGKSTLWNWVKAGKFPSPVKLSRGVTAWRVEDVRAFLDRQ